MENFQGRIVYNFKGRNIKFGFTLKGSSKSEGITVKSETKRLIHGELITVKIIPESNILIHKLSLTSVIEVCNRDKIFLNGYQSWTDSREFRIDESIPGLSGILKPIHGKYHLSQFGDYHFHKYKRKKGRFHSYSYTYIHKANGLFLLFGSLSEKQGFTKFQYDTSKKNLTIEKDCPELTISDEYPAFRIVIIEGSENEVFDEYFKETGIIKPSAKPFTGWTSWYNHFTNISEEIIIKNLNVFMNKKIPIDVFQIDDGYQKAVGDWEVNQKFPKGLKYISDSIKQAGFKSGLWIAPFICEQKSELFKNHNDWVLKDGSGKPVLAGMNDKWSGNFYALDYYNSGFIDYIKKVFKIITEDWGFDLVKLDFLYAACLLPRRNKTRGQIMCEVMEFLREICGNKITLGCGVPLSPAFGLVDYCRIGSDVGLDWEYNEAAIVNYRERVSTINTIISSINRRHLNGRAFLNDPDAVIVRHTNNTMTTEQRHSLLLVNSIFGGIIFTSDNPGEYNDKEMSLYLSQFPLKEKRLISVDSDDTVYEWKNSTSITGLLKGVIPYQNVYNIKFEIDGRSYYAFINLGNKSINIKLPAGVFYSGRKDKFFSEPDMIILGPYESDCFLKAGGSNYEIAGSTGHIFPGCDIESFKAEKEEIGIKTISNPKRKSDIYIKIPDNADGLKVNNEFVKAFRFRELNLIKIFM